MRDFANFVEFAVLAVVVFLVLTIFVTMLSGTLYAMLKFFFGKRTAAATEPEPGQVSKKAKKAMPAAVAATESFERIEPSFGDVALKATPASPLLAKSTAADVDSDDEAEPDAAVIERDSAFADRMADQFAAEPVSA